MRILNTGLVMEKTNKIVNPLAKLTRKAEKRQAQFYQHQER